MQFKEIGPHFDLVMRRNQVASADLYKLACKKPKVANVEKKKARMAKEAAVPVIGSLDVGTAFDYAKKDEDLVF